MVWKMSEKARHHPKSPCKNGNFVRFYPVARHEIRASHLFRRATDGSTDSTNIVYTQALPIRDKKYVLSNSESVQCNFFIFDHVTLIQFKICCCVQILSKSDDFSLHEIWRYINFKMAAVRHLGIVLPPYETTHEVSVAGRSFLSNFTSI